MEVVRRAQQVNLNDKNRTLTLHLLPQQNDVVYVEPYKQKSIQADNNPYYYCFDEALQ